MIEKKKIVFRLLFFNIFFNINSITLVVELEWGCPLSMKRLSNFCLLETLQQAKPALLSGISPFRSPPVSISLDSNRYVSDYFAENYRATQVIDFASARINIEDNSYRLQLWDIAGQDRYRNLSRVFPGFADIHAFIGLLSRSIWSLYCVWFNHSGIARFCEALERRTGLQDHASERKTSSHYDFGKQMWFGK